MRSEKDVLKLTDGKLKARVMSLRDGYLVEVPVTDGYYVAIVDTIPTPDELLAFIQEARRKFRGRLKKRWE